MSKAARSSFTGISDQADVTLLYLLLSVKKQNFQKIIIEGDNWVDFTLEFSDHYEDYEVKSHREPLSYSAIRRILTKVLAKEYSNKNSFNIVVRKLNKEFKQDYGYMQEYIHWIQLRGLRKNNIVRKFLKNNWSINEILILPKIKIIEFRDIKYIRHQIYEYFALGEKFYLEEKDIEYLGNHLFRKILEEGKKGGSINKSKFIGDLKEIEIHISEKSESFPPNSRKLQLINNIKPFLRSNTEFIKLKHHKFLTPLSNFPFLIFYITDELNKNDFSFNDFEFFLKKILIKENYVREAIRLIGNKYKRCLVDDVQLLDFIILNYNKFIYDFNYDDALRILKEVALKDVKGQFDDKIINFLKKDILLPFTKDRKKRFQRDKRGWREDEQVAEILKLFLGRVKNKKDSVDFIFNYFDFTSDDFDNVIETHPLIYSFVKDYIKDNLDGNFNYIVRRISNQFNIQYNGKYKGYEWIGSGIGGWGTNYSITDKGVVRLLFQPLFHELYNDNPKKAWQFFKQQILDKVKQGATKDNPVYLKRTLIPILINRLEDDALKDRDKRTAYKYLQNILRIKRGIPGTSEIVFHKLRGKDLEKLGFNKVMELINLDSIKYKRRNYQAGFPTNLFVISTLFRLIKLKNQPAKEFFISLIRKPDFIKYDQQYNTFELLVAEGIPTSDPDFIVEIFNNFDFEKYLNSFEKDIVWDKSGIILELIKKDWQDNTTRGQKIMTSFFKDKIPGEKVLEFLAGPIRNLSQIDPLKTYDLLSPYLVNKEIFLKTFQNNSYVRENIASMGEDLIKSKNYEQAKHIVDLCIDDPDPETDKESQYNYHIKIKNGEKESGITSVRGKIAWVLQQFAITNEPELMEYAFENTRALLDLDGSLAKKLNYKEPDLYVRKQALVPFIELAHPWRRKKLNEYKHGLGDSVKKLAFDVLTSTDEQFKTQKANPKAIVEYLVSLFSYIRDLTIDEAKKVLNFFEEQKETAVHFLFTYFAEFHEKELFDSTYFKGKLKELCLNDNPFKQSFAWEFWRIAEEDCEKKMTNFERIEKYWKLLFEEYNQQVFDDIYRTLDITLTWPNKYAEHKNLLKIALEKEVLFYKDNKQPAQLWEPGSKTFQILFEHDTNDFLEFFYCLLNNLNDAASKKIEIHYFFIKDWINIFKSIKLTTEDQRKRDEEIRSILGDLYPEYLENS